MCNKIIIYKKVFGREYNELTDGYVLEVGEREKL